MKNLKMIRRLAKENCAYYDNGFCFGRDTICIFHWDSDAKLRCYYFEKAVLPEDAQVDMQYKAALKLPFESAVRCKCGNYFWPNSNRQIYCKKCAQLVKKESARKSMAKKRSKMLACRR